MIETYLFEKSYEVDVSPGWPLPNEPVVRASALEGGLGAPPTDYLTLRIYPEDGSSWYCELQYGARGLEDRQAVCAGPAQDQFFVLASGQVYHVDAQTRLVRTVKAYPIIQILPNVFHRCIWLAGFTSLMAVSGEGNRIWQTMRLVSDDLKITEIQEESFSYQGFEAGSIQRYDAPLVHGVPGTLVEPMTSPMK